MKNFHPTALGVCQTKNGFFVNTYLDHPHPRETLIEGAHVFQSFAELVEHLSEHFTHRTTSVQVDKDEG